jgi:uncharacterized membrane protein
MAKIILFIFLFLISLPSYAYIGPGMGGGVLAAIFGFFAAILLALFAILYYPIKRAIKNKKNKKSASKKILSLNVPSYSIFRLYIILRNFCSFKVFVNLKFIF